MIKRILVSLLLPGITFTMLFAQTPPPIEFGNISKAELEMTDYDQDTAVAAVVLFDYAKYSPTYSTRHTRIKILKPQGLQYANAMEVIFKNESFRNLKGSTYNLENGRMVETKMDRDNVFTVEYNRDADFKKFALPQVRVGSVIEYRYEVKPIGNVMYIGGRDWNFQRHIPTIWSELIFERSRIVGYDKLIQGYHPLVINEDKGNTWRWAMSHVPAFRGENMAPPEKNFMSMARISLSYIEFPGSMAIDVNGSWENIGKLYYEEVLESGNVKNSKFLKDPTEELVAKEQTQAAKVDAIYKYIKKNIEWNDRESVLTTFAKNILEKRQGNSGQINLSLLAMLRYADLEAYPVLISTRENSLVRKDFPEARQFDRVIVQVMIDKQPVFLDATDRYLPMEYLPEACLNGEGLLVESREKVRWVEVKSSAKQRSVISVVGNLELKSTGDLEGKVSITKTGYEAKASRKEHSEKGEERYKLNALASIQPDITKAVVKGIEEIQEPVKEEYSLTLSSHATVANDVLYLDPMLFNRLDQSLVVDDNRVYPIDLVYPRDNTCVFNFKLPPGYHVDEMPKPYAIALPNAAGRYTYNAIEKDGVIMLVSQFVMTKSFFSQVEYAALREFYNAVAAKQTTQIVIRKKN